MALQEGDPAPNFSGQTQTGETISLADFSGKTVVLYFYPKDDTPGCTKEACSFRDSADALDDANVVVIGVSADSSASHLKFAEKYDLPFHLIADTEKTIINAYGCWGEKKMYGVARMGILRHTYVINGDGTIRKIFTKVKTAVHADEVLAVLDA